jgi:hypothetical protein
MWEARTNLVLNSLLDGTNLSTQSVTVAAVAHTLSFYGTGTVTLSGVSTAGPLVGSGATTRVSLTFTPTAGSLTLTVSGTVKWCNLEAGSFATPFIATAGAAATRAAPVCSTTDLGWYNQNEGSFVVSQVCGGLTSTVISYYMSKGVANTGLGFAVNAAGASSGFNIYSDAAAYQGVAPTAATVAVGDTVVNAAAYKTNDSNSATRVNSTVTTAATDTSVTLPTSLTTLVMGARDTSAVSTLNGWIKSLSYYPTRLPNATLQALST